MFDMAFSLFSNRFSFQNVQGSGIISHPAITENQYEQEGNHWEQL